MSDIGVKIGLEGEKQFKSALTDINQAFKVLGSEMKLVASQFDKNDTSVAALSARNGVLTKEIDAQRQKIEVLRQALQNASESFGENDRRTQSWQIQLNNAEAALNDLERELAANNAALEKTGEGFEDAAEGMDEMSEAADDVGEDLDDVADSADDAAEGLDDAGDSADKSEGKFSKLGGVLKTVGAALGAVVVAAAGAAVKLGKEVITAYADYEQLVGGIDTLFGDSSRKMQDYAANAYRTAGLSANAYMETVTSFSASLIASLGGDTEKAVQYADMAITDMSDNANKMGTDMSMIQTAYQGFAKQNYTMLDNLKLGYGGTKTEMERLLADATKLSGIEYDISSYADIVDAIHVIQTEMGITGTTAKEADSTITGSINSMSAAWQNMLVGLGDANSNMGQLSKNLMDSVSNVIKNITPIIANLVDALPVAVEALGTALMDMLPTLLSTAAELFRSILSMLIGMLPQLIPFVVDAVMTIVDALIDNLPLLVEAAIMIIISLTEGIAEALPELIPAIVEAVILIITTLMEHLPEIIQAGIQVVLAVVAGLIQAIPQLVAAVPQLVSSFVGGFNASFSQFLSIGTNIVQGVWNGISNAAGWFADQVKTFFSGIVDGVKSVLGIASPSKVFAEIGGFMSAGLGEGFTSGMKDVEKQMEDSVPTDFDFAANAHLQTAFAGMPSGYGRNIIEHTGIIRVEGINNSGDLTGVVDILIDRLRQEVRL